jgi:hypothetical protein
MKTILLFVSAVLVSANISAQDQPKKQQALKKEATTKVEEKVSAPTTTISAEKQASDGANPTPEEQGYTKQTINGKDVYVKESGNMIFYYEPRK